jgi:glutaredoxin
VGSIHRVVVFHADGCHLCERALAKVRALREELEFELEEIAIDGSAELEARYRELIPVVEIDGERVFTFYVHEDAFRRRLRGAARGLSARGSSAHPSELTGRHDQG